MINMFYNIYQFILLNTDKKFALARLEPECYLQYPRVLSSKGSMYPPGDVSTDSCMAEVTKHAQLD